MAHSEALFWVFWGSYLSLLKVYNRVERFWKNLSVALSDDSVAGAQLRDR